jgi:hypothetical protein
LIELDNSAGKIIASALETSDIGSMAQAAWATSNRQKPLSLEGYMLESKSCQSAPRRSYFGHTVDQ